MFSCFNKILSYLRGKYFPFLFGVRERGERVCGECYETIDTKGILGHFHLAVTPYHEDWLIGKIVRGFKYNYEEIVVGRD